VDTSFLDAVEEITLLVDTLQVQNVIKEKMAISQFLNPEEEVIQEPCEDTLAYLSGLYGHLEEEDYEPTGPPVKKIGIEEVLEALSLVSLFDERQETPNQPLTRQLERYTSQIKVNQAAEHKQTSIRSYFTRN
jgi:hypothetical protein